MSTDKSFEELRTTKAIGAPASRAKKWRPRVLLADNHRFITEALQMMLSGEFEIVAAVSDGRAMVEFAKRLKPDAVVAEIGLPELDGLEAGRMIRAEMPSVKLIFLTKDPDPELDAAFRLGADGYLLKNSSCSDVIECLHSVLAGQCAAWCSPLRPSAMVQTGPSHPR